VDRGGHGGVHQEGEALVEVGGSDARIRILCLGNDLLADDAFGPAVGKELRRSIPEDVEVITTQAAGFNLLEEILGATYLLVIDTILTGRNPPGKVLILRAEDVQVVPGNSPHSVGLFETLELGRRVCLPVPEETVILAVEAADCTTLGGSMDPRVRAAIPAVVRLAREIVHGWRKGTVRTAHA